MPEKELFEYAVIRIVPRVEREEFINVGVIVFCAKRKFLKMLYTLNESRIMAFSPTLDMDEIRCHLQAFDHIANGTKAGGAIAQLDPPSRFRWLTATRSTVVQSSKVHPGLCGEPEETLQRLHQQMVL